MKIEVRGKKGEIRIESLEWWRIGVVEVRNLRLE